MKFQIGPTDLSRSMTLIRYVCRKHFERLACGDLTMMKAIQILRRTTMNSGTFKAANTAFAHVTMRILKVHLDSIGSFDRRCEQFVSSF